MHELESAQKKNVRVYDLSGNLTSYWLKTRLLRFHWSHIVSRLLNLNIKKPSKEDKKRLFYDIF